MSDHDKDERDVDDQIPGGHDAESNEEFVCAVCGGPIEQDDLVCPNCGVSLVAG